MQCCKFHLMLQSLSSPLINKTMKSLIVNFLPSKHKDLLSHLVGLACVHCWTMIQSFFKNSFDAVDLLDSCLSFCLRICPMFTWLIRLKWSHSWSKVLSLIVIFYKKNGMVFKLDGNRFVSVGMILSLIPKKHNKFWWNRWIHSYMKMSIHRFWRHKISFCKIDESIPICKWIVKTGFHGLIKY